MISSPVETVQTSDTVVEIFVRVNPVGVEGPELGEGDETLKLKSLVRLVPLTEARMQSEAVLKLGAMTRVDAVPVESVVVEGVRIINGVELVVHCENVIACSGTDNAPKFAEPKS